MPPRYTIRQFTPGNERDYQRSVDLMQRIWGAVDFCDPRFVHWQYGENPFGRAIGYFAFPDDVHANEADPAEDHPARDEAAAQYMVIPSPLWLPQRGAARRALLSVNTATHPEHRQRGLFRKTATAAFEQAAAEGYEAVYGFPNDSSLPGFLSNGFTTLESLRLYGSLLQPLPFITALPVLLRTFRMPAFQEAPSALEQLDAEAFRPFLARHGERLSPFLHAVRDEAWLRWRYQQHPTRRYTMWQRDSMAAVLRLFSLGPLRVCLVFDLFGTPRDDDKKAFRDALKGDGVGLVCGVFSSSLEEVVPGSRGLLRFSLPPRVSPKQFHVIFRSLREKPPSARSFFTLGDLDLY